MGKGMSDAQKQYLLEYQAADVAKRSDEEAAKRFSYLLGLTDLFRHFIDARAAKDPEFKQFIEHVVPKKLRSSAQSASKSAKNTGSRRNARKSEKQEDQELLKDEESENTVQTVFQESPYFIQGKLREYQIDGLNWMISLYENNISGILADEMGLGKTLQTISFLAYLRYVRHINGPHLILVPKSTLENWQREFARWTPEVRTIVVQGDKETRGEVINNRLLTCEFDVCITSYEMVLREKTQFRKFAWQYVVIDEAHRIKNEESQLAQIIRMLSSRNRLLITGTPLQNNLHELWALLNFLLPDVFSDSEVFDEWFSTSGEGSDEDREQVVQQLHKVLRPFLLRRVKAEVEHSLLPKVENNLYVPMSKMQRQWYQKILEHDISAVNGAVGAKEKTRLLNIVMQLRKCCNHPYLFDGAEPGPPFTNDEHLVFNSGKLAVLDVLLKRLKEQGSRVLIFSQMSRVLDIMEDYCWLRGYKYCRIDGSTDHEVRINMIDEYNKPGSDKFIFLLTTRAGGLGINLVTADTVVLFDSDWNPQADLQAMDRAHRIGQTKQVHVYRMVTDSSVEEKVVERAAKKLRLDQVVIQQGNRKEAAEAAKKAQQSSKDELLNMIQHGAQEVMNQNAEALSNQAGAKRGATTTNADGGDGSSGSADSASGGGDNGGNENGGNAFDIDAILAKGQSRTQELQSKYDTLGLDELQRFDGGSETYEWNGQDYKRNPQRQKIIPTVSSLGKRGGQTRSEELIKFFRPQRIYEKDDSETATPTGRSVRKPRQMHLQDFQFWPQRLYDLQAQELAYHHKITNFNQFEGDELDKQLELAEMQLARPLTEEEQAEKKHLSKQGFSNWNRREFVHFIGLLSTFGRDSIDDVVANFGPGKTELEIRTYYDAFWRRYTEIDLYERYMSQIAAGEEKQVRLAYQMDVLKSLVENSKAPMQELTFDVPQGTGKRLFTEEEDRFLVVQLYKIGLDAPMLYEQMREAIRESSLFRFDWFFLSRTPAELSRRCQALVTAVTKEDERKKRKLH